MSDEQVKADHRVVLHLARGLEDIANNTRLPEDVAERYRTEAAEWRERIRSLQERKVIR